MLWRFYVVLTATSVADEFRSLWFWPGIACGYLDDNTAGFVLTGFRAGVRAGRCFSENLTLSSLALGLCFGAYATEVFRGALLAIPRGHREAGLALGLSRPRILFRLVLPQMWRIALPGLGNLFMILMKDTALVSVVGLNEVMRSAQVAVTSSKQPFTFFMVAACIYLTLTVISMLILHLFEKRANRGFTRSAA